MALLIAVEPTDIPFLLPLLLKVCIMVISQKQLVNSQKWCQQVKFLMFKVSHQFIFRISLFGESDEKRKNQLSCLFTITEKVNFLLVNKEKILS